MSGTTNVEIIKKARIARLCDYCGERIEVGQSYNRWRSFGDSVSTVKVHPECHSALQRDFDEYQDDEFQLHEGERPSPVRIYS